MKPTRIETRGTCVDLSWFDNLTVKTQVPVALTFKSAAASCRVTLSLEVVPDGYSQGREIHQGAYWSKDSLRFLKRAGLMDTLGELVPYCLHEGSEYYGETEVEWLHMEEDTDPEWIVSWVVAVPAEYVHPFEIVHYN